MRNISNVQFNEKPVNIVGKVSVSYCDPITGKVKEQIKDTNHAFNEMFQTTTWYSLLNTTNQNMHLVLTDDTTPASDAFPYLQGNILGWGTPGIMSSGNRGTFRQNGSFNATPTAAGYEWRWIYDFAPNQAQGLNGIQSIGITNQFGNNYNLPVKRIQHMTGHSNYVFPPDSIWGYRCTNSVVTRFNPRYNEVESIMSILGMIENTSNVANQSLFYELDTNNWLLYCYHGTASNRRVYRFNNDFTTLLDTFNASNLPVLNGVFVGPAYEGKILHYNLQAGRMHAFDCETNTHTEFMEFLPSPIVGHAGQTNTTSCLIRADGTVYYHNNVSGVGEVNPIVNIISGVFLSWLGNGDNSWVSGFFYEDEFSPYRTVMISSNANAQFIYKNAFTKYVLPSDFPPRPTDSSVVVTYNIEAHY